MGEAAPEGGTGGVARGSGGAGGCGVSNSGRPPVIRHSVSGESGARRRSGGGGGGGGGGSGSGGSGGSTGGSRLDVERERLKALERVVEAKRRATQQESEKSREEEGRKARYSSLDLAAMQKMAEERAAHANRLMEQRAEAVNAALEKKKRDATARRQTEILAKEQRRAEIYAMNACVKAHRMTNCV